MAGQPPALDLSREAAIQKLIVKLIRDGLVDSAHDCSEGGLAITLAECTFDSGGIGVVADIATGDGGPFGANAALFGESASRIVVSLPEKQLDAVTAAAKAAGVTATVIGKSGGDRIQLTVGGRPAIDSNVSDAEQAWATAIATQMGRR